MYGNNVDWSIYSRHAGQVLVAYLSSLPESLIPAHGARRLTTSFPSNSTEVRQNTCVNMLKTIPEANRITLVYLLAFFASFNATSFELASKFQHGILRFDSDNYNAIAVVIVDFLISNASAILLSLPESQPILQSSNFAPGLAPVPRDDSPTPVDTHPHSHYVTATYDLNATIHIGNDYLSYKLGDRIRVVKRTDRVDGT